MKKIIAITAATVLLFAACTTTDNMSNQAQLTLSTNQIILDEDKGADMAIELTWEDFAPGAEYTVEIANLYSVGWDNVWSTTVKGNTLSLTVLELENALLSIGREAGSDAYIKLRVVVISDSGLRTTFEGSAVVRLYIPSINLNVPTITASTKTAVLSEANKMNKGLELSWTDASVENEAVRHYVLEIAKAADAEFLDPIYSDIILGRKVVFYQIDLNVMLLQAGYTLGEEAALIYRIKAVPENEKVKGSVSETQALSVSTYKKPVPTNISAIYIAGSGVESGWSIPSEIGKFADKGNGIYEWTGKINDNGGTFKILFNGGWSSGFRHGSNDYYWEDAQYVTNIGDNDYGVVLAKGTYKITIDAKNGSLSREIIKGDRDYISITECKGWTKTDLPSINESNTVFQGNVSLVANDGFIVVQGDGNRNWVRRKNSDKTGLKWKMSERRAKNDDNESLWFHSPESRSYKITVDIQNNILTLE